MPGVARVGDYINTGHLCDNTATISSTNAATNVYINGKLAALQGTQISPHQIESQRGVAPPGPPTNPSICIPHTATVKEGSSTVRVNGKALARQYDAADEGSITGGSPDVNAN